MLTQMVKYELENSPIYSALLQWGLKAVVLDRIRIRKPDGSPFPLWSLHMPSDLPPYAWYYAHALAVHRHLLEDNTLSLADKSAAWARVAEAIETANAEAADRLARQKQSVRARRPRSKILSDGSSIRRVVERLNERYPSLSAKEMWPHFISKLEDDGIDLTKSDDVRGYATVKFELSSNRYKTTTFRNFQNVVSKVRSKKVSS